MEEVLEKTPQELSLAETPVETPLEEMVQKKADEQVHHEELSEPLPEVFPEITLQEEIVKEVPGEEPPPDVSSEEVVECPTIDEDMHEPVVGSTETVVSALEETVVEDFSSADELSQISVETGTAEMTHPEEVAQELPGKEARSKLSWKTWLRNKLKKEDHQEELSGPSTEVAPEAVTQEVVVKGDHKEDLSIDVVVTDETATIPSEEIQTPATTTDLTKTSASAPEETVIEDVSSADESSHVSVETGIVEVTQPEEVSLEISEEKAPAQPAAEEIAREEVGEKVYREESFVGPSPETTLEMTAHEEVVEEETTHEDGPLEPSIGTTRETSAQEEIGEEVCEEEPFVDVSVTDETVFISPEEIQTPAITKDSTEVVMSVREETIIGNISFIDGLPHVSVETSIANLTQHEEVPQEISEEEAPGEPAVEEIILEKAEEKVSQEEPVALFTETIPEIAIQEMVIEKAYQGESLEPSLEVTQEIAVQEMVGEEVCEKEPFVDVSVTDETVFIPSAEIQTPAMTIDSTETVTAMSEETIVEDTFFIDGLPQMSVETGIADTTQPEDVSQKVSEEGSGSKLLWWTRRKRKPNRAYQEQLSEPSMGASSQTVPQEGATEEAHEKGPFGGGFVTDETVFIPSEEIQTLATTTDLTKASASAPEETVVEDVSSINKLPQMSIKTGIARVMQDKEAPQRLSVVKAPVKKTPIETTVKEMTQEKIKEVPRREKLSVDSFAEEAVETPPVDETIDKIITALNNLEVTADVASIEDSVAHEEVPEGLSDNDFASLSDEEKAAMTRGRDSAEVEGFIGIVNAQPNPAYKGLPISIAYTLRNVTCENPDDFFLQIAVVNPDTGISHDTFETPVKCLKDTSSMGGFVIFTTSYETYVYRLTMQIVSKKEKMPHLLADLPLEIKAIF